MADPGALLLQKFAVTFLLVILYRKSHKVTLPCAAVALALGGPVEAGRHALHSLDSGHTRACTRPGSLELEGTGWDSWGLHVLAFPLPSVLLPFNTQETGTATCRSLVASSTRHSHVTPPCLLAGPGPRDSRM